MTGLADNLFWVTVQPSETGMCVVVTGELDLATAGRIEAEVIALLDAGCATVEIDLRALEFMDSSGVHELLRCRDHAADWAVPLRLLVASGPQLRALTICAVLDRFDVEVD